MPNGNIPGFSQTKLEYPSPSHSVSSLKGEHLAQYDYSLKATSDSGAHTSPTPANNRIRSSVTLCHVSKGLPGIFGKWISSSIFNISP